MIITTGRKPSPRTRTFCRHLARFTGSEYFTRGKTSLSAFEDEPFLLLVGEYRGNPGRFSFFSNGRCILSVMADVSADNDIGSGQEPVISGDTPLAHALGKASGLRAGGESDRVIRIHGDRIEFMDRGISYIILTVIGTRGELSV